MEERLNIWFDKEGDFLEIMLIKGKGFFRDIGDDIWESVDEKGKITGIAVLNFRKRAEKGKIELPYRLNLSKSV